MPAPIFFNTPPSIQSIGSLSIQYMHLSYFDFVVFLKLESEFLSFLRRDKKVEGKKNSSPADVQRQAEQVGQVLPEDERTHFGLVEAKHRRDRLHVNRRGGDALQELRREFF